VFFAPYDGVKRVSELKADGKEEEELSFEMTIGSIGDVEQTVQEVANLSRSLELQVLINLSAINLQGSDFAGATLHEGKFKASALRGADFSGADLTGISFCEQRSARNQFRRPESDGLQSVSHRSFRHEL